MYDKITEEYINQRIGEQMLSADQWSSLTRDLVNVLRSWRLYTSQDRVDTSWQFTSVCDNVVDLDRWRVHSTRQNTIVCVHPRRTVCSFKLIRYNRLYRVNEHPTGWMFVYTIQPVVKPVVTSLTTVLTTGCISCKRGFRQAGKTADKAVKSALIKQFY